MFTQKGGTQVTYAFFLGVGRGKWAFFKKEKKVEIFHTKNAKE